MGETMNYERMWTMLKERLEMTVTYGSRENVLFYAYHRMLGYMKILESLEGKTED